MGDGAITESEIRNPRKLVHKIAFQNSSSSPGGNQSVTFSSGSGTLVKYGKNVIWYACLPINLKVRKTLSIFHDVLGENFHISVSVSQNQRQVN